MAEFFHAGRTNTDDCYDAGKHVHGSRRVYGHDDASRSRPAYADEVGALAAGASSKLVNIILLMMYYCIAHYCIWLITNQMKQCTWHACSNN
jgi:hypothetical protein